MYWQLNGESEFPLSIHQSRCILDKAMTFMYNIMQTDGMPVFEIIEIEQQNDLCMMTLLMMIKNIPLTMHSK